MPIVARPLLRNSRHQRGGARVRWVLLTPPLALVLTISVLLLRHRLVSSRVRVIGEVGGVRVTSNLWPSAVPATSVTMVVVPMASTAGTASTTVLASVAPAVLEASAALETPAAMEAPTTPVKSRAAAVSVGLAGKAIAGAHYAPSSSRLNTRPAVGLEGKIEVMMTVSPLGAMSVKDAECAQYILYDKPPKTGSSSVTNALQKLLRAGNQTWAQCDRAGCLSLARRMCTGESERTNLIMHIGGDGTVIECLRTRGFYTVTTVREPKARWESAFLFNRMVKGTHFGISYKLLYAVFMQRMPECNLLSYLDGGSGRCGADVGERAQRIAHRYDEIIDLGDEGTGRQGSVWKAVKRVLETVNRSAGPDGAYREKFNMTRVDGETAFYKRMRWRQAQLLEMPGRQLCAFKAAAHCLQWRSVQKVEM